MGSLTTAQAVFEDVTLEWKGLFFEIPATHILRAMVLIEEIITVDELRRYSHRKTVPVAKLAMAYGVVLRYGGSKFTDDQIYAEMMQGRSMQPALIGVVTTNLLKILAPRSLKPPKAERKKHRRRRP